MKIRTSHVSIAAMEIGLEDDKEYEVHDIMRPSLDPKESFGAGIKSSEDLEQPDCFVVVNGNCSYCLGEHGWEVVEE